MLSQLSLKRKLLLFALVPVLVLSLLGCVRLFELLHNYRLASQSYHAVEVGRRLADLIYELQQERGLSAAYIACNGECFADSLQVQQQRVSTQITALQNSPICYSFPDNSLLRPNIYCRPNWRLCGSASRRWKTTGANS